MPSIVAEMAGYLNTAERIVENQLITLEGTLRGHIYNGRRPKDSGDLAATISRAGHEHYYHLSGETDLTGAILMLRLYGSRSVTPEKLETEGEKCRLLLSGFMGVWGTREIESVRYLPVSSTVIRPIDGSDYWDFTNFYMMQVNHKQTPIDY